MTREPASRRELAERYGSGMVSMPGPGGTSGHLPADDVRALVGYTAELADRRQRAREAAQDALVPNLDRLAFDLAVSSAEVAIETAIRVRVTSEIEEAARQASGFGGDISSDTYERIIKAAFEAAGFEVEQ